MEPFGTFWEVLEPAVRARNGRPRHLTTRDKGAGGEEGREDLRRRRGEVRTVYVQLVTLLELGLEIFGKVPYFHLSDDGCIGGCGFCSRLMNRLKGVEASPKDLLRVALKTVYRQLRVHAINFERGRQRYVNPLMR